MAPQLAVLLYRDRQTEREGTNQRADCRTPRGGRERGTPGVSSERCWPPAPRRTGVQAAPPCLGAAGPGERSARRGRRSGPPAAPQRQERERGGGWSGDASGVEAAVGSGGGGRERGEGGQGSGEEASDGVEDGRESRAGGVFFNCWGIPGWGK